MYIPVLQTSARRKNWQGPGNIVSGYLGNTSANIGKKSANLKKYKNIQFQLYKKSGKNREYLGINREKIEKKSTIYREKIALKKSAISRDKSEKNRAKIGKKSPRFFRRFFEKKSPS